MTFRPTRRRSRKSHSHCVLPHSGSPSGIFCTDHCPLTTAHYSDKSFPLISFADPHPLTLLESYRFKNRVGEGDQAFSKLGRPNVQDDTRLCPIYYQSLTDSPAQRQSTISFPFNDLRTLFIATEGTPHCSHFGTHSPSYRHKHYPISAQALTGVHFATPFLSYSSRNGEVYPLLTAQKPPDGVSQSPVTSHESPVTSSSPIAAHALWCHNPQRHEISSRSRETTPLLPVSKTTRADIGNCSIPLPVTDSDSIGVASRA